MEDKIEWIKIKDEDGEERASISKDMLDFMEQEIDIAFKDIALRLSLEWGMDPKDFENYRIDEETGELLQVAGRA
jgi:hypothetical protein